MVASILPPSKLNSVHSEDGHDTKFGAGHSHTFLRVNLNSICELCQNDVPEVATSTKPKNKGQTWVGFAKNSCWSVIAEFELFMRLLTVASEFSSIDTVEIDTHQYPLLC